jgi:hypothetical protein
MTAALTWPTGSPGAPDGTLTRMKGISMSAKEIESTVSALLEAWAVNYSVSYVGAMKRNDWECDAWSVAFTYPVKGTPKGPLREAFQTMFYTGIGLRKKTGIYKMAIQGLNPLSVAYKKAVAANTKPDKPHAASVLHSLVLDAEAVNMSFTDWCDDYGYDSDSIKALSTYQECCKTGEAMRKMFTREQMEQLREALQDY